MSVKRSFLWNDYLCHTKKIMFCNHVKGKYQLKMKEKKFIRWISIFVLSCLIQNFPYNSITRASQDNDTLVVISQHLKANRKILNSFECEYIRTRETNTDIENKNIKGRNQNLLVDIPERISYKGHFAFEGDKILSREEIGDAESYFLYIKNGDRVREIHWQSPRSSKENSSESLKNPRTFIIGTADDTDFNVIFFDFYCSLGFFKIFPRTYMKNMKGIKSFQCFNQPFFSKVEEVIVG